jgi:hypothetical protein
MLIHQLLLFENRLITAGIVFELVVILAISYTAPGHALFGTAPIGFPPVWLSSSPSG